MLKLQNKICKINSRNAVLATTALKYQSTLPQTTEAPPKITNDVSSYSNLTFRVIFKIDSEGLIKS